MPRAPTVPERPEGLAYVPDLLTPEEEAGLVRAVEGLDYSEVRMHGQAARRTVRHYGVRYDYDSFAVVPTDPLPEEFEWLRERAGALAGIAPEDLVETLVTRYPPGAGIGYHRDAPRFGPAVVGVSLLSACPMRFQRRVGDVRHLYVLDLAPRSAYVIGGKARSAWQHGIVATKGLRYSFTFRTLAGRFRAAAERAEMPPWGTATSPGSS
ncbi:MAG: alpha-ketoglutarate-dependent dioxygenase AlkB [Acidimicrobiia bacterium]